MENQIENNKIDGTIINSTTIILRGKPGCSVEGPDAKNIIAQIEKRLPGDYVLIIDRVNEYSVAPVGVYKLLNSKPRLKAMAIVVYRSISDTVLKVEKSLCHKPLQTFSDLDSAIEWTASHIQPSVPESEASNT